MVRRDMQNEKLPFATVVYYIHINISTLHTWANTIVAQTDRARELI